MYTSKNKFKNTKRKKFLYAEKSKYFSIKVNESQISMRTSIFVYDLILLLRERGLDEQPIAPLKSLSMRK